jgi:chemotaxis signal transduction protein
MTETEKFLVVKIAGQHLGLRTEWVSEVLPAQPVTPVAGAAMGIAGIMVLRGRLLVVINLAHFFQAPETAVQKPSADIYVNKAMNVIVTQEGRLYSLEVDAVGTVCEMPDERCSPLPVTLPPQLQVLVPAVCRLPAHTVMLLDMPKLLAGFGP